MVVVALAVVVEEEMTDMEVAAAAIAVYWVQLEMLMVLMSLPRFLGLNFVAVLHVAEGRLT